MQKHGAMNSGFFPKKSVQCQFAKRLPRGLKVRTYQSNESNLIQSLEETGFLARTGTFNYILNYADSGDIFFC